SGREAQLSGDLWVVERADLLLPGDRRASRAALIDAIASLPSTIVLTGESAWEPSDALRDRMFARVVIGHPDAHGQARLWRDALAGPPLAGDIALERLASRLQLTGGQIHDAAATARGLAHLRSGPGGALTMADLDEGCRRQSSRRFGALARKVPARLAWDDLVL